MLNVEKWSETIDSMEIEFRPFTNVTNSRKDKDYFRTFGITANIKHPNVGYSGPFSYLTECVRDKRPPELFKEEPFLVSVGCGWSDTTVSVRFSRDSDRPSKIPSLEACWGDHSPKEVGAWLIDGILRSRDMYLEDQVLTKRVADAENIRSWVRSNVTKYAKSVVRYEQRLAALEAEYMAEVTVQYHEKKGALLLEALASEHNFDPIAARVGVEMAEAYVKLPADPFHMAPARPPITKDMVKQ